MMNRPLIALFSHGIGQGSVENYESADLIEVRKKDQKDFFIPFSKATIKKVDLEKKLLLVQNVSEYLN